MSPEIAWLTDIVTAAERIRRYIEGFDHAAFLANDEKQSAVFGQLVIIGEASNRLSREFQKAHPAIPWPRIISMRNRIIHGYDEIDWDIVWQVSSDELPAFVREIQRLIPPDEA